MSRVAKFCHGDHAQNRGVRDKSRDLGTLVENRRNLAKIRSKISRGKQIFVNQTFTNIFGFIQDFFSFKVTSSKYLMLTVI